MDWRELRPLDLSKINFIDYPEDKYFKEKFDKKQVTLHHTVSGPGIRGDLSTWLSLKPRIGTCIIIDRDGTPNQMFSSRNWSYHTGMGRTIDRHNIGIEFDNWGPLKEVNGRFRTVYGNAVDVPVTRYPDLFREYEYFETYTDEQIQTAGELLLFWRDRYGIPLDYKEDMWDVSRRARSGEPGVWTHVSYRSYPQEEYEKNKWDCHPQENLIDCLKELGNL